MGVVTRLPPSIASLSRAPPPPRKSRFTSPISSRKPRVAKLLLPTPSPQLFLLRSLPNDSKESLFLDENGVVEDMDGYLNYLSLEYDSVWDTKPLWCQPWTITLTGVLAVAASWALLHSAVVTAIVSSLICAWWYIFLYLYPKEYAAMIAERRNKVTSGVEDTFGRTRSQ
ncbi:hypothetical protein H6P81_000941 [Aristolochia fimbriata]|uniref:DUF6737 domain-containing protein n=1 Tax=Aristolochia fimbriata TaxID=158543 RepID=A0AAV7F624_ARIFI|nr:hypothetical protein H6P81_000941 [Aristolochia fimbriata]